MARNLTILEKEARPPRGRAGFTLVELLVVIGIVALISGLVTINWRGSQDRLALQRSAVKVSQDIKRAAELSLRGQPFSCAKGSITGYGVYFTTASSSYIIFADCNNNQRYDAGTDGIVETLAPEAGVVISAVSPNPLSIVFIPPDPVVWINGSQPFGSASFTVTLALQSSASVRRSVIWDRKQKKFIPVVNTSYSVTKPITINSKGVISIQ